MFNPKEPEGRGGAECPRSLQLHAAFKRSPIEFIFYDFVQNLFF